MSHLLHLIVEVVLLTADTDRTVEGRRDLRVHLDHQVLLHGQVLIAAEDLLADPRSDGLAHDRVCDVDEPLPRHLVHVPIVWEEVADLRRFPGLREDAHDIEVIVLRAEEELDVIAFDAAISGYEIRITYNFLLPVMRSRQK